MNKFSSVDKFIKELNIEHTVQRIVNKEVKHPRLHTCLLALVIKDLIEDYEKTEELEKFFDICESELTNIDKKRFVDYD